MRRKEAEERKRLAHEQNEKQKAEYDKKLKPLKEVKEKYLNSLLDIDGVYGVGLRVFEEKIVVYIHRLTKESAEEIPNQLDGYGVEVDFINSKEAPINPDLLIYKDPSTKQSWFDYAYPIMHKRPLPSGGTLAHVNVTAGTLGSWWWSNKINAPVLITNNHVSANSDAGKSRRVITLPSSFTVLSGGDSSFVPVLADRSLDSFNVDVSEHASSIDSVTPSSAKIGELITITGKSLGFRWGYSKVFIGGMEAQVKSWVGTGTENIIDRTTAYFSQWTNVSSVIEVYVPSGLPITGTPVDVIIEVEGDPVLSPGVFDGGQYPRDAIGYSEASIPLSAGDVGACRLYPEFADQLDSRVWMTRAIDDRYINYNDFIFNGEFYENQGGFLGTLRERTAVIKTGRTTGTTISYVLDAEMDVALNYWNGSRTIKSVIQIEGGYLVGGVRRTDIQYNAGGDSGSSTFTCSQELFDRFYTHYGLDYPASIIFETPFKFLGNHFAGSSNIHGYSDNYQKWAVPLGLELEPITSSNVILIMTGNAYSGGECALNVGAGISPIIFIMSADSTSTGGCTLSVETLHHDWDFHLVEYELPTGDIIFHLVEIGGLEVPAIEITMSGASTTNANFTLQAPSPVLIALNGYSNSLGGLSLNIGSLPNPISLTLNGSSISLGGLTLSVGLPANPITLTINGVSATKGDIELSVGNQVIISLSGQSILNGKVLIVIPGLNIQIEEITLTIQRELTLDLQIQRNEEVTLAI